MKEKVKFGVIGCSSIAKRSVIPAIKEAYNSELKMLASRSLEKAKKFATNFLCESYGSYDEVLENDKIDAIYVSLPIGLQEKWIIKSAKAGKHVLCEKSAVTSLKSAEKIIRECKKNNTRVMEGFAFKFHTQQHKVMEIMKLKSVGKIFSFSGRYGFVLEYSKNNFRFNKKLGGGILNDVGCYLVNAGNLIFQCEPNSVVCNLEYGFGGVDIIGSIYMTYDNNKTAYGTFGYNNFFQSMYSVWGTRGMIALNRAFNTRKNIPTNIVLYTENKTENIKMKPVDQFKIMIEEFCKEVQFPGSSRFEFEKDFVSQARTMEALRKSDLEKKVINLNKIK